MQDVLDVYSLQADATAVKVRQVLREFDKLGIRKTSELKPAAFVRWLKSYPDRSPATNDSLWRSMRGALSIGVMSGYVPPALMDFKLVVAGHDPDREGRRRHHSAAEVGRVLATASEEAAGYEWRAGRLEALVWTYAFCALRRDEALFLRRQDVDLGKWTIRIEPKPERALKTPTAAGVVPIPPPLRPVLARWLPRSRSDWVFPGVKKLGPWTGGPPGHKPLDQVKKLGRRAGVYDLTILSFRHSFATHAPNWGLGTEQIRLILRHTSQRTQKAYRHADIPDLLAAVERVNYPLPAIQAPQLAMA